MAFPVTLNGRTYTLTDFEGTNYVDGLPDAFEDFVTHAGDIYNSTSTTSNSIGTGSKTFTVESAKPYQAGTPLRIADASAPSTNFIDAIVTSYSGTTLVVDSVGYAGSGTFTSWNVNIGGSASVAGTVAIAQGGTGATTAAAARTNLDVYSKADADSRFLNVSGEASNVTMTGDVTIGDASSDTLTVAATAAFDTDTLYVDATNDRVGVGVTTPDSNLHVYNGSAGSITASGSQLVVENNTTARLTFLSPSNTGGVIEFGDPDDQDVGKINYDHTNNEFRISAGAQPNMVVIGYQDIVINENSYNADFRVESDNQSHMLFVDASANSIGIRQPSPDSAYVLDVSGATRFDGGSSTFDTDTNANPLIVGRQSATSECLKLGVDDNYVIMDSVQDENFGRFLIRGHQNGGSTRTYLSLEPNDVVVNDGGEDHNFRVESDNLGNMFVVDASTDRIGIGTSSPEEMVHAIKGTGNTYIVAQADANPSRAGFQAKSDNSGGTQVRGIFATIGDQSRLEVGTITNHDIIWQTNNSPRMKLEAGGGFVFNEDSADLDFRVEGDNFSHCLFVDGGVDQVVIGDGAPRSQNNNLEGLQTGKMFHTTQWQTGGGSRDIVFSATNNYFVEITYTTFGNYSGDGFGQARFIAGKRDASGFTHYNGVVDIMGTVANIAVATSDSGDTRTYTLTFSHSGTGANVSHIVEIKTIGSNVSFSNVL